MGRNAPPRPAPVRPYTCKHDCDDLKDYHPYNFNIDNNIICKQCYKVIYQLKTNVVRWNQSYLGTCSVRNDISFINHTYKISRRTFNDFLFEEHKKWLVENRMRPEDIREDNRKLIIKLGVH